MRVLVCGGRFYTNKRLVWEKLDALYLNSTGKFVVIEGGADGADYFARQWVRKRKLEGESVEGITVHADWKLHGRKLAGGIRNQQMLDEYHPELVLAFPGHKGTKDMISRAMKAKVRIIKTEDWSLYEETLI